MLFFKKKKNNQENDLTRGRRGLQEIADFWDMRVKCGDPLFDQWMVDSWEATKEALVLFDKLEETGAVTGKESIKSSVPKGPEVVEVWGTSYGVKIRHSGFTIIMDDKDWSRASSQELIDEAKRIISLTWQKVDFSSTTFKTGI